MNAEHSSVTESAPARIAESRVGQVRRRAYAGDLARKRGPGSVVEDWLRTGAEITWKAGH